MRFFIYTRGTANAEKLRSYAERRLRLSTSRFERQLGDVTVQLEDVNGPRGGPDKLCRIMADVPSAGRVVVEERGEGFMAVAFWAAKRFRDSLKKRIQRRRTRAFPAGREFASIGGNNGKG
jgi:hypothetical protein